MSYGYFCCIFGLLGVPDLHVYNKFRQPSGTQSKYKPNNEIGTVQKLRMGEEVCLFSIFGSLKVCNHITISSQVM